MTEFNGADQDDELTLRDLARLAAREPSMTVIESVPDDGRPTFEQASHDLLLKGLDKIADQWVGELGRVRDNTKVIEQLILTEVTAVKTAVTRLHLLGKQAMIEAERGHQVNDKLGAELDRLMQEHHA